MSADQAVPDSLTERSIGCSFTVANTLGIGFLEKVYENALAHEMRKHGLGVIQQQAITVRYDNTIVGEYTADLVVENQVIVELKVVRAIGGHHVAQCMNYLQATGKRLCLLINSGCSRIGIRHVTANVGPRTGHPF